ncbi:ABC transporter permease [Inediibacterium massiliense]|uniref:ABC transporter permease n=1 Tax=Inediibacterium massiliense TaxID=1658111 RepID=UPI0006B4B5A7|nr:ABC transporter permease [Inediibacterium massiliense]
MLVRALKAEQLKLRNSPIWMAFFIIPFISAVMGTFNYLNNTEVLSKEWYSLWTQHTLFYCYFCFPALIGVYCSYICRLEHMNNNWNGVMTMPIKISTIYFSKLITVIKITLCTQILVGILFYISGRIVGFHIPMPNELFLWLLFGFFASIAISSLQLAFSLVMRSFSIPIGIALIGGILGLVISAKGFGLYFPYSLFSIGMCSNNPSGNMEYDMITFMISCIVFVMIFSGLSILKMKRVGKDFLS